MRMSILALLRNHEDLRSCPLFSSQINAPIKTKAKTSGAFLEISASPGVYFVQKVGASFEHLEASLYGAAGCDELSQQLFITPSLRCVRLRGLIAEDPCF